MKLNSTAHVAPFVLWGVLCGCAPTRSATSDTPVDHELQVAFGPSARSIRSTQEAHSDSDRGQSTSRLSLKPRVDGPTVAQSTVSSAQDTEVVDAEWTMTIQPDATVLIQHKGSPVVHAQHVTWAEKTKEAPSGKWVGNQFKAERVKHGQGILNGTIRDLNLQVDGAIHLVADNELRFDYDFEATKGHTGIYGCTLDWKFALTSPSFESKAANPVIFDDKTGWMWPVGPNQAITVRFDQPLDDIFFEAGQKHNIRTFFYADHVDPGKRHLSYSVRLPDGGRVAPSLDERYGSSDTKDWFREALNWDESPIDLSFLNAQDRPAGRHGTLKAKSHQLVFEDGTPARFWGANLAAYALFSTPRQNVRGQAHRMAKLGFNLMRIVHHDAKWVKPNIFVDNGLHDTRHLSRQSLDSLDWWVKCLEDEGIYVWLDFHYQRVLTPADGVAVGFDEINRSGAFTAGFSYLNRDVLRLMQEFQHQLLEHVNPYTRLAYKSDPAVVGMLITNENDLTSHFGNIMLPDKHNPVHNALFMKDVHAFAQQSGLPENRIWRTWEPGPSKPFLNALEHRFNRFMIDDLRSLDVRTPLATTSYWGKCSLFSLPALTEGDVIDVHSYGTSEALGKNPRYEANFLAWIGTAQVQGKPLSITEWGVPYPEIDRFTAPLYLASIASLQGWDMPMLYNYSQAPLRAPGKAEWEHRVDKWSTFNDPALCGVMPAGAVAFRREHISPARTNYCLMLTRDQLLDQELNPQTSATLRTLVEQSRLTIGFPAVKELPWLKPTETPSDAMIITDPNHDYIPSGQSFVRSDTGELLHNWKYGIQTINTPKTQAASGWIGGKTLQLGDATFRIATRKAVIALTSLDDKPLSSSRYILVTTMARVIPATPGHLPFMSEPVVGTIILRTKTSGFQLLALNSRGKVAEQLAPQNNPEGLMIQLPTQRGTHWYVLKTNEPSN